MFARAGVISSSLEVWVVGSNRMRGRGNFFIKGWEGWNVKRGEVWEWESVKRTARKIERGWDSCGSISASRDAIINSTTIMIVTSSGFLHTVHTIGLTIEGNLNSVKSRFPWAFQPLCCLRLYWRHKVTPEFVDISKRQERVSVCVYVYISSFPASLCVSTHPPSLSRDIFLSPSRLAFVKSRGEKLTKSIDEKRAPSLLLSSPAIA